MSTNPLRNENRLKLGVFGINSDYIARTLPPEKYQLTWPNSLDVAEVADKLGLEAIVPLARFRAFSDARHHSGHAFECFSWAAAVAARTNYSAVMCTIPVMNIHPIYAAKALTTIDHVSYGRLALNMVCGWFKEESEMFGYQQPERDTGYEYADEWISCIKRLWTEEDEFDFDGHHIHVKRGMSQPKPIQTPCPVLMNAGVSADAQQFVAKHCDIAFIRANHIRDLAPRVQAYRDTARKLTGREIQIWMVGSIVHGDSDSDAKRLVDHYAKYADRAYIDAYLDQRGEIPTSVEMAELRKQYAFAGGGMPVIGDATSIAEQLAQLSASGVDGVLLTWVDFQNGIRRFGEEILPQLEAANLRMLKP